jgi:glycosyltransferase involved in cell wall biosynthesis
MKNKIKKIGILAFLGNPHGGGIFQYTQSIVDALSINTSEDIQYIIITDHDENSFDNYGLEVRKINKSSINILKKVIKSAQLYFKIRKPLFFSQQEMAIHQDIDLFISPTISFYPHFYLNKPFVFTLHDLQERYYPEYFSLKEKILRYIRNTVLSEVSTHIICESNYVKADIVKFLNQKEEKISVIPAPPPSYFINFKFEEHKFAEISAKYKLPTKYLFYPAQFWYHKNHIKLLEAFKLVLEQYNDIHLVLTGARQNNYENVISKIKELKLENKVLHLGYIDYEDLPYIYKMSEMLVMPTLFESISIPIYEAFALKVPVCASNVVALPEQVGDAGLLFDPNNINDINQKIIQIIIDQELKENIIKNGYLRILNFSHKKYKIELIKVIENIFN